MFVGVLRATPFFCWSQKNERRLAIPKYSEFHNANLPKTRDCRLAKKSGTLHR